MTCLLGAFFAVAAARAQEKPAELPAVAFAGRVAGDANSTRIYFDLDRKVEFSNFTISNPDRIIIDSPTILFRFADPAALDPRGLVSYLRYGAIARERSRIILTLARPARIARFEVEEISGGTQGAHRLVIDLVAVDAEEFAAIAEKERERVGRSGEVVTKGDRLVREGDGSSRLPVVVLDPGHGGIDGGAKGRSGIFEKELTLEMARRVKAELDKLGVVDARLTRTEDVFVSLRERVNFSRRNEARLFISLHADSVRQSFVRGASVYTLSNKASDALAEEIAESANLSDEAGGVNTYADVSDPAVPDILLDLKVRETSMFTGTFSRTLVDRLAKEIELLKNPLRKGAFVVLKDLEAPAVLFEMGYLSNEEDEKLLTDPAWQETLARLVAQAIAEYFESHGN